jgi:FtsZ-binding cell division protein ZapB
VADATQTIFFVDWDWRLTFRRLNKDAEPVLNIDKSKYFELKNKSDRTLTTLCHATELGDNIEITTGEPGVTQYIRNNPFWDLRDDVDTLLEHALDVAAGLTISQFDCSWRGNYALEIGDKVTITTKDDDILTGYVLNDTLTYNGGLKEECSWQFTEHSGETAANPVNLGEALKQTFAKVDKANKTITLYASEISETKANVSEIQQTTQEINMSVSSMEQRVTDIEDDTNDKLNQIYNDVSLKVDKDSVDILVEEKMAEGVDKVVTSSKKYSFDDEGLNISSSLNSVSTTITEDGMTINRGGKDVLVANNEGVYAEDLHATTYLIIGNTSRLEDYNNRTTCYWIGG